MRSTLSWGMERPKSERPLRYWIMNEKFDAVVWMREQRTRIDRETDGYSWQERRQWVRDSLKGDPLWESLKHRALSPGEGHYLAGADR